MIKNTLMSQTWTNSTIAANIATVFDYIQDVFANFEDVTIERSVNDDELDVFFDIEKKVKMAITIHESGGLIFRYYLNSNVCSYTKSTNGNTNTVFLYLRTDYGIAWGAVTTTDDKKYNKLTSFFTAKDTPTLIVGTQNTTCYLLSPAHQQIERRYEVNSYLGNDMGEQRFAMCNVYACDVSISIKNLYRVLGYPTDSYPRGKIIVGNTRVFFCGKYALEYEEE